MKLAQRFFRKIEYWLLGGGLLLMAVILFTNVILRKFFSSGLSWAEEAARYLTVWITFIGASTCVYKGGNISIDSLLNYLSEQGKRSLTLITISISIIFSGILIYLSSDLTIQVIRNKQYTTALHIPMGYIYASMPIGATLTLIRYSQEFWDLIKNSGRGQK